MRPRPHEDHACRCEHCMRWMLRRNFENTVQEHGLTVLDTIGALFGFSGPLHAWLCEFDNSPDKGAVEILLRRPAPHGGAPLSQWRVNRAAYGVTWITMKQDLVILGDVELTVAGPSVDQTHIFVAIDAAVNGTLPDWRTKVYN